MTPESTRPRPVPAPARLGLAVLAVALVAGCSDASPDPAQTTDDAAATSTQVPGVPISLTVPDSWVDFTSVGSFVVAEPAPDDGAARTNVVVTGEQSSTSLADASGESARYATGLDGWSPESASRTTLAGETATMLRGKYSAGGTPVTQESWVLTTGTGADRWIVRVTTTAPAGDDEAAQQVHDVIASMQVTPT